ncbi:hypothetical protein BJ508DRAFT_345750 [Ascobolus immersus RN42]|uniref:non-specific serine/threonine protein kinase n=1 Tax=Ascobolus immersus RN42 TaxID=1160509 RepID=A0A3N4I8D1_ASCIM|nr:hypothetical protein BJ508DRAFT_345750 [Ascobolus immersus RN42]
MFTNLVAGYGSQGTMVLRGSFEGKDVAVKRMLNHYYDVAKREVSLLQESDDHPNVIRYYCRQELDQFLYIALELCPASLYDLFSDSRTEHMDLINCMRPEVALQQITAGVRHLHSLKIVHRDLKPQNILVQAPKSRRGITSLHPRFLISDFGLCKKLDHDQSSFRATTAHAAGTSGWRAPELLCDELDTPATLPTPSSENSTSTSDTTIIDTLTSRRATKAIDIFSLGCVFYYVLSGGSHPFGDDRIMREPNIVRGTYDLRALDYIQPTGVEARDLISRMIARNPKERPDANTVLMHPFFWPAEKRLQFLLDISDHFEAEPRDPPSPHLQILENEAAAVLGEDWYQHIDQILIDNLGKYRKYSGQKILDLLRALRNKKHHYQDLPPNVQEHLGSLPDGYLNYFMKRFPMLLMHCHRVVMECELQGSMRFGAYFLPPGEHI